jgi:hypothetical protein
VAKPEPRLWREAGGVHGHDGNAFLYDARNSVAGQPLSMNAPRSSTSPHDPTALCRPKTRQRILTKVATGSAGTVHSIAVNHSGCQIDAGGTLYLASGGPLARGWEQAPPPTFIDEDSDGLTALARIAAIPRRFSGLILWPLRPHDVFDGHEGLSLCPQSDHFSDGLLVGLMRDKLAVVAAPEHEGNLPAEIPATGCE